MPDAWYNASWSNRRKITFDNSGQAENLTNFPVLVKLNSSRIDYAKCKAAGADIRFTDSDGTTLLSYEIEKWNSSGDSFVWVKVPQIDSSSSTDYIYVYYGNSGASDAQSATSVWRSEYKGVWHLAETGNGTAGEYKDSTSNANHGRGGNGTSTAVPGTTTGPIGTAATFDGTADYIAIADAASLYISGSFSVGAWVYRTGTPGTYGGYIIGDYNSLGSRSSFYLKIDNTNKVKFAWETSAGDPGPTSTNALTINTWYFAVGTWDGTTRRLYVNGAADTTNNTSQSRADDGGMTTIGKPGAFNGLYLPGYADQVWVYSGALSAAWIAAQYKSEADTFATYGSEESQSSEITGTASLTQAGNTVSAAGMVAVVGTASKTQAAQTVTSAGTVSVSGALSKTQAAQTLTSAGAVAIVGTLSATQAANTLTATATAPATGTAALTQAANTLTAAGTVAIAGALSKTQAANTVSSAGVVVVAGTASITQAGNTTSAAGTVAIVASASMTQASNTLTATGTLGNIVTGTAALTQAAQTVSAAGTVAVVGAASITQAGQTVTAIGAVAVVGSASMTQAGNTLSASGGSGTFGAADLTQAANTIAGTGTVAVTGAAAITQAAQALAAAGAVAVAGASALTQAGNTVAGVGVVLVTGAAAITQASNTLTAYGWQEVPGDITGGLDTTQDGNTVSAAGVVFWIAVLGTVRGPGATGAVAGARSTGKVTG